MSDYDPMLLTGQLLVRRGVVEPEALAEALSQSAPPRIGERLVEAGAVAPEILEAVLSSRDLTGFSMNDTLLGELAIRNGFVTREQVAECVALQDRLRAEGTPAPRLGEMLLEKQLLTAQELDAILQRQETVLAALPASSASVTTLLDAVAPGAASLASAPAETSTVSRPPPERRPLGKAFADLLFPQPLPPLECRSCGAAANPSIAIACGSCGERLWPEAKTRLGRLLPWLTRIGFVAAAAAAGFLCRPESLYLVFALIIISFGAALLRYYPASQMYFVLSTVVLYALVYLQTMVLQEPVSAAIALLGTPRGLEIASIVLTLLPSLAILVMARRSGRTRTDGWLGALVYATAALLITRALFHRQAIRVPLWIDGSLAVVAILLGSLLAGLTLVRGFHTRTQRPGVVIQATRPLASPQRPVRPPKRAMTGPRLARVCIAAGAALTFAVRISVYHLVLNLVRFTNTFVYFATLSLDLLLRSMIRTWRRLVELTRSLLRTSIETAALAARIAARFFVVCVGSAVVAGLIASMSSEVADQVLNYQQYPAWGALFGVGFKAVTILLLLVATVALLMRCFPIGDTLKEVLQALSLYFPNALLLFYVTAVICAVASWVSGAGPFTFGRLSILVTVLLVAVVGVSIRNSKRPRVSGAGGEPGGVEPVRAVQVENGDADGELVQLGSLSEREHAGESET